MRAELRRLHSPDVLDLRSWTPEEAEFEILVQAMIGPAGAPGEESFDIVVSTIAPLAEKARQEGVVNGLHRLVVLEYDFERLWAYIAGFVSSVEGDSWGDLAAELSTLGHWEFDRYHAPEADR
jgi:hypothetical protein